MLKESMTQLDQNFFINKVVNMWNDLPREVVMAPTVNWFKRRFDRYSADNRYSMEWRYGPPVNAEETTTQSRQHMNIGQQAFLLIWLKTDDDDDDINNMYQRWCSQFSESFHSCLYTDYMISSHSQTLYLYKCHILTVSYVKLQHTALVQNRDSHI